MLQRVTRSKGSAARTSFAIVASRYNELYVDSMLRAARSVLKGAGAARVRVVRVPGAYEIPIVAARLARLASESRRTPGGEPISAILCLGVILRGETTHAAHIGDAVSRALMEIQVLYEVPVIHEVLLLENEEQARKRCLDRKHNRGAEAAETAIAMAAVMRGIQ